jgi:hypothetical protein
VGASSAPMTAGGARHRPGVTPCPFNFQSLRGGDADSDPTKKNSTKTPVNSARNPTRPDPTKEKKRKGPEARQAFWAKERKRERLQMQHSTIAATPQAIPAYRPRLAGKRRPSTRPPRANQRLAELRRIIQERGDQILDDVDDADLYLVPVAQCFRQIVASKPGAPCTDDAVFERMDFWAENARIKVKSHDLRQAAFEAIASPFLFSDDVLGRRIRLSYAERHALEVTSIGSYDADQAERTRRAADRKRASDRVKAAAKRRKHGAEPRQQYLANSASRNCPWTVLGVSKRTYYRHLKASGTGPSSNKLLKAGDGPVPRLQGSKVPLASGSLVI